MKRKILADFQTCVSVALIVTGSLLWKKPPNDFNKAKSLLHFVNKIRDSTRRSCTLVASPLKWFF